MSPFARTQVWVIFWSEAGFHVRGRKQKMCRQLCSWFFLQHALKQMRGSSTVFFQTSQLSGKPAFSVAQQRLAHSLSPPRKLFRVSTKHTRLGQKKTLVRGIMKDADFCLLACEYVCGSRCKSVLPKYLYRAMMPLIPHGQHDAELLALK